MSIDLKELEAELLSTRRKVTEWAASLLQLAAERKDQHTSFLSDQAEKLRNMHSYKAQLQVQAEHTNRRLDNEEDELKRIEERLVAAKVEASTSERRMEASKAHLRKRQEEYRQQVEELESDNKAREEQLDSLRKDVAQFAGRFGLNFRSIHGGLTVTMTHIDGRDHDKEFYVIVCMAPGDVYTVSKCEPMISDMDELLDEVNRTNNFAAFVKAVRARFIAIARDS